MRRVLAFALLLLAFGGCSKSPSALSVFITVPESLRASCVRLEVLAGGMAPLSTGLMKRDVSSELVAAVFRTPSMPSKVRLLARGYVGPGCELPNEESEPVEATFPAEGAVKVVLSLLQVPPWMDADGDGYRDENQGGSDCSDLAPGVNAGAAEACSDGVDNDCNRAIDCADARCAGEACGKGGSCDQAGACVERTCDDAQDNDGDGLRDCKDPDCTDKPCAESGSCSAGQCLKALREICTDGHDNDADRWVDCLDPDCDGRPCEDFDYCTLGEVCGFGLCGAAPRAVTCPPASTCRFEGRCLPASGNCEYAPKPAGASCDDGNACTAGETCAATGKCAGASLLSCEQPPGCRTSPGTCSPSLGCQYPQLDAGTACDDGNACTAQERCGEEGACTGSIVSCTGTSCSAASCDPSVGCVQNPFPSGTRCGDGGVCGEGATCSGMFPFDPSNFSPRMLPLPTAAITIDCSVDFNTTSPPDAGTWCGRPAPAPVRITRADGSVQFIALPMKSLRVNATGRLRLSGIHPIILVVLEDAEILGTIEASAEGPTPGPGGSRSTACGEGGNGAAAQQSGFGSMGGGGGGGAFGAVGAAGGASSNGANPGSAGGTNGGPLLVPLRGGCSGGRGGDTGGEAGAGGGALQLTVGGQLSVSGRLSAGGGGGRGSPLTSARAGGGGGGSGGAILLEAERLALDGFITANGGSGGEGNGSSGVIAETAGANGLTGRADGSARTPNGGDASNSGGNGGSGGGGNGASVTGEDGAAQGQNSGGGGGGGGGVGRIRLNSSASCASSGVISPPPATNRPCP